MRSSVLALALALSACGPGVHDLGIPSSPILVVHGHVDLTKVARENPDAGLIAVLVWAGVPQLHAACVKWADNAELQRGCPDPYGVFVGQIERAAPVDGDGNFTLELTNLPLARNSIGDTVTRIAYGTLIVGEDVNGPNNTGPDGELTLAPGGRIRRGGGRGGGGGGGGGNRPGGKQQPEAPKADVILAASFWHLKQPQERLVFREGDFVSPSNFYPAPQCGAPPPGFSVLDAPAYESADACANPGPEQVIELTPLTAEEADAFMCRQSRGLPGAGRLASVAIEPTEENAPDPALLALANPICLSHEVGAIVLPVEGGCPSMQVWSLKGCRFDMFCEEPEWDHTDSPPSWWPCP